jgi:hypothetical protein
MEQKGLYKSFIKCKWPQQIGNLASTLARLSSSVVTSDYDETSRKLLREVTLLIEWSVPNLPEDLHNDLAFMQRELYYWYKIPLEAEIRKLLSLRCRIMSDHMLEVSGLIP